MSFPGKGSCVCVSLDDIGSKHADRTCGGTRGGQLHPTMWCALLSAIHHLDAHVHAYDDEVLGSQTLRQNEKCHRMLYASKTLTTLLWQSRFMQSCASSI